MEQKHVLLSALGVGIGVGLGLGLATGGNHVFHRRSGSLGVNSLTPAESLESKLRARIVDGKDFTVNFEDFSSYLSEQTKALLTSAAFLHLQNENFVKYTANLPPASRSILLSGSEEPCHQMLAKAIAHSFGAKMLVLDTYEFMYKAQGNAGSSCSMLRSFSGAALDRMNDLISSVIPNRSDTESPSQPGKLRRQSSNVEAQTDSTRSKLKVSASEANLCALRHSSEYCSQHQNTLRRSNSTNTLAFDEKLFIQTLYKVLMTTAKITPIVLYLRDVEGLIFRSRTIYHLFKKMTSKLAGPILILGSRIHDPGDHGSSKLEKLSALFPYCIAIEPPPDDKTRLVPWRSQLEEEIKVIKSVDNKNRLAEVLEANDLECYDLNSISFSDLVLGECVEEIVVYALSHHIMNTPRLEYRQGKLNISSSSLLHALNIFKQGYQSSLQSRNDGKITQACPETTESTELKCRRTGDSNEEGKSIGAKASDTLCGEIPTEEIRPDKPTSPKVDFPAPKAEPPADNEFEKRIRPEIIPAGQIGVSFEDIGALDSVKESLRELVMLPLRRPDLFKGGLLKPCKGILLFGPPGTGKTMLAKALANEAHASFINVSMSTVTSKWFGEDEKNVRALFSLAAKVAPTVIFVDEVDSMLGQRSRAGEHEAMRKIKNEFMVHWDGLRTKADEHVLVLAATNRPFDLDEAIIRRFERRIMVGLPTVQNREQILRALLQKENVEEGFDFKEAASITEGFSGSDLKVLCTTAAFRPLREFLKKEQEEKTKMDRSETRTDPHPAPIAFLRPLSMKDIKDAKKEISPSYASEGAGMHELRQWNDLYGEGGSRKKQHLTYFM